MRMLVVGAGATGGYFGGRLVQIGRDVTFLVRPKRAAQLAEHGLQLRSPHGDATLHPKVITTAQLSGTYDVVLLTVKAFSLQAATADFAPAIGTDTMILPVLNGMRHVDLLSARFGTRAVAGCACKITAVVDGGGRIVQLSALQDIVYGEIDGALTPRIRAFDAFMQGAAFEARLTQQVAREMWEKWILLATLGGVTCLMRGNVGEIAACAGGIEFVLAFLQEVAAVVTAVGVAPSSTFLANAKAMLIATGSPMTSSMYRDLESGSPIEADQIVGDLLTRAAATGIKTPLLAAAYAALDVYQRRLSARARV